MCETMFSSQTRQNVHISTPLPPALFRENTTVVSRTAKMELFFPVLKVIQDVLFVRLFLYVADSFFLFQRVFFSECRNSLFRDRRTRFVLRDVERRFEGSYEPGVVYTDNIKLLDDSRHVTRERYRVLSSC